MGPSQRKLSIGLCGLFVCALAVGAAFRVKELRWPSHSVLGAAKVSVRTAKEEQPPTLSDFRNGFNSVIQAALPAVVNISSSKVVKQQQLNTPELFNDPMFRQFFGEQFAPSSPIPKTEREYSLGSGVIVSPDGYILTNNHVVSGASDVEVFTQDRKKYKAKVIGTDSRTDIAVLRIEATGLPTLPLANSSQVKVGDLVFAIGDPFGVGETATMGIVSATGRGLGGTIERYENFIQTDAPINPGNSGGALINLQGNLVGINTAIISGGGGNQGIGFAIPINLAHSIVDQLVDHGKVIRGYLGVSIQGVDPDLARAFGLSHGGGALIGDVQPNSAAAKAGVERGDVVLQLNGQEVSGPEDLSVRISQLAPGSLAHLKIFRNGQSKDIDVTLGEFPENAGGGSVETEGKAPAALKGLQVQNLTPDIAKQLGLPLTAKGVVVNDLDPASPAADAGIQQGDVIQEVNRKPVHNLEEYRQALATAGNQSVLLLVNRGGTTLFVVVAPQ